MDFLSPLLVVVPSEIKAILQKLKNKDRYAISSISVRAGCIEIFHRDGKTTINCPSTARMKFVWSEDHATDTIRIETHSISLGSSWHKDLHILRSNLTACDIQTELEFLILMPAFSANVKNNESFTKLVSDF